MNYNHSLIFRNLVIHLDAYVIKHVNNLLIVMFPLPLLILNPIRNLLKPLRILPYLIECHQPLQPVPRLRLNLLPLQLIILQYRLHLLYQPLLLIVHCLLLHPKRPLNILKEMLSSLYLPLSLLLPLLYYVLYVPLLLLELLFHLPHVPIYLLNPLFYLT